MQEEIRCRTREAPKAPGDSFEFLIALDLWFEKIVKAHCKGDAMIIRYADDFVCAFRYRKDAIKFFNALPKRLDKFELSLAPEKTGLMRFSRFHPGRRRRIIFLGFEIYWTKDLKGKVRVMQRTAHKKLQGACRRIKDWVKGNRHLKGIKFITALNRRLYGHYNYYSVVGNLYDHSLFFSNQTNTTKIQATKMGITIHCETPRTWGSVSFPKTPQFSTEPFIAG